MKIFRPTLAKARDDRVMTTDRFEILEMPPLKGFVLISLFLHIAVMVAQGLMPDEKRTVTQLPPVKVKYIPPEQKAPPQKVPTLADIPKPLASETPDETDLIARYDSRAHSNRNPQEEPLYRNKKTAIPKAKKSVAVAKKTPTRSKKQTVRESESPAPKQAFRPYDKGFALPKEKGEVSKEVKPIPGGTLALLDGFDPDKYAAMDTDSQAALDDGEAISLNTKESRYASYFARIKRQIELVWNYPDEAQRKGITGELTLRFQISRDGNLMNVRLINGSGYNVLDEAALQAVKSAAPYYPFPVTIDREALPILANFIYSPRSGFQYIPRR